MAGLNKVENINNDLLLSIIHSYMVNNLCKPGVKCVLLFLKRGEVSSLERDGMNFHHWLVRMMVNRCNLHLRKFLSLKFCEWHNNNISQCY